MYFCFHHFRVCMCRCADPLTTSFLCVVQTDSDMGTCISGRSHDNDKPAFSKTQKKKLTSVANARSSASIAPMQQQPTNTSPRAVRRRSEPHDIDRFRNQKTFDDQPVREKRNSALKEKAKEEAKESPLRQCSECKVMTYRNTCTDCFQKRQPDSEKLASHRRASSVPKPQKRCEQCATLYSGLHCPRLCGLPPSCIAE